MDNMFSPRDGQEKIVEKIITAFNKYDNVILSAPTGAGKSFIAWFVLNELNKKSIILNHQKVLIDQYDENFGKLENVVSIKGKNNYECYLNPLVTVDMSDCNIGSNKKCKHKKDGNCLYYKLKEDFKEKKVAITNYQFVLGLLNTPYGYNRYSELGIYDECHNIESIITDFKTIPINKDWVEYYNSKLKFYEEKYNNMKDFAELRKNLSSILNNIDSSNYSKYYNDFYDNIEHLLFTLSKLDTAIINSKNNSEKQSFLKFKNNEEFKLAKWENYKETSGSSDWILDIPQPNLLELIPLRVDKIFPKLSNNIADKNLMMSATIIDPEKSLKLLGLNPENSEYIEVDSEFPIDNRRIYFMNAVNLNYRTMQDKNSIDMKNTIEICKEIVMEHSKNNESGFIFAPSYQLCNTLNYKLKDLFNKLGYTVLFNKDIEFKDAMLLKFLNQKNKSILISPSFSEGVNFNDDISRFQIIVKTPYASLGSNYIKTKMNREKDWYGIQAFLKIMQISGRSIRHKDDYSKTYILDKNAIRLFKSLQNKIPEWFKKACLFA